MKKKWLASLKLVFKNKNKKTFLYKKTHKGPILVQKEFYPEKICHVYIIHPPGGLVSGDKINISVKLKKLSQALITNPSSTKFYRSYNNNISVLKQKFYLEQHTSLEFLPQSNIFFADAILNVENHFFIDKNVKLFAWDSFCFKKTIENKRVFGSGSCITNLQIWKNNIPLLNEKTRILNGDLSILLKRYYFVSTIIAIPGNNDLLKLIYSINYKNCIIGSTLLDDLLIIRMLNTNNINMQKTIYQIWRILRPRIIGAKACKPRIWNT